MTSNYILKYHDFYRNRLQKLRSTVLKLKAKLPTAQFLQHESTKLLARLYNATDNFIPQDPHCSDYYLKGALSKFGRFKRGLQRYRLIFCFADKPLPIIVYLYVNDKDHLRKDGDKNDPYEEFEGLVQAGLFSHNPHDPKMKKWLYDSIN